MTEHMDLVDSLAEARLKQRLTMQDVEERMGLHKTGRVSRWERGVESPVLPSLVRWADVLGLEVTIKEKS